MRCRGCGYQLTGLSENRCPECGRPFNHGDRATYLVADDGTIRQLERITLILMSYPFLTILFDYATAVVAYSHLGHWPIPSMDDPKSISSAVSLLRDVTLVLLIGLMPVLVGTLFVAAMAAWQRRRHFETRWGWSCLLMAGPLITWAVGLVLMRMDPLKVGEWLMD